ncbi:MAG: DUF4416 family protein [Candidatus Zixiibacteriota bacterium]|nr:MAG: DUF4416 family protein [candidate division Zixibacteria bacterium]
MPGVKPKVKPVKLICAALFFPTADLDSAVADLENLFGKIDHKSPIYDFTFTDYYNDEMGKGLKKFFLSFENLIMPDQLADIKNSTNKIEAKYSAEGKRTVNLDPGYLEESKLILASTKNFSHRIYLKDGIWAELTLSYASGKFVTHPWSYPDYQTELVYDFLRKVRDIYISQLKK